jgi:hypothetical protein
MIENVLSRPITFLAVLAFTNLALANTNSARAAEPLTASSDLTRSSSLLQVDSRVLPALLPSMSQLVQSPYADAQSIGNPLGIEQKPSSHSEVIRSVYTSPLSASFKLDAPTLNSPLVQNPSLSSTPALNAPPVVEKFPVRRETTFGLNGSLVMMGR